MILDFSNKNIMPLFELFGETIYLNQSLLSTWVVMAILIVLAVVVRIMLPRFQQIPKGFQNFIELIVDTMEGFASNTMGPGLDFLGGYFFSVFAFILLSNLSGLFGLRPPTADLSVTLALTMSSLLLIHGVGIFRRKSGYVKNFFKPNPIFFPINLIGEISKPISLCFRLLGNMLGGLIIIGMVYSLLPRGLQLIWPAVLHAYFDIFAGSLQAFIFTILSMTFIAEQAGANE